MKCELDLLSIAPINPDAETLGANIDRQRAGHPDSLSITGYPLWMISFYAAVLSSCMSPTNFPRRGAKQPILTCYKSQTAPLPPQNGLHIKFSCHGAASSSASREKTGVAASSGDLRGKLMDGMTVSVRSVPIP